MIRYYVNENGVIRLATSLNDWFKWKMQVEMSKSLSGEELAFEKGGCRVMETYLDNGAIHISTIFLDVGQGKDRFETMVFGGITDEYQTRYRNVEAARIGHEQAVKYAKGE